MKYLRIIDEIGNREDVETEFVPRIGERIVRRYAVGNLPLADHYFRVKDVEYWFDNRTDVQARILVQEEAAGQPWPA